VSFCLGLADPSGDHVRSTPFPLRHQVFSAVAIARGVIDPDRIAILGQSDGGYATLSLISQTTRFRSAIASGAPTDFASLYDTFYGAYRFGDSGDPRTGQLLRMLQCERACTSSQCRRGRQEINTG
jgi:hypothetical protein